MSQPSQYTAAGVDIDAGQRAVNLMTAAIRTTYGPEVLSDTGNFGGLYDAGALAGMGAPVLVASTDGVGTKTRVAARLDRWDSIGHDIVNHCVNDILVQGAHPLFFLDYVASSKLIPEQVAAIVSGAAAACRSVGCALLGGETAEMPGVYLPGEIDLVGTVVGVVDRDRLIDGQTIRPGDVVLALPSSGLHTNGYSLARAVLEEHDWTIHRDDLGCSLGEALLTPHRAYLKPVEALREAHVDIRGLAHITGGGITDNLPRILPEGTGAVINRAAWQTPPLFRLIQHLGDIDETEMLRVFNMGLGMLVVVPKADAGMALKTLPNELCVVGEIVASDRPRVVYQGGG